MEKQIEEMAKVIDDIESNAYIECYDKAFADADKIAETLYNAGYRKQSEPISCGHEKDSGWISVDERLPTDDEIHDEYGELVPFLVVERDTQYPYRAFYDGTIWGDGLMKIKGITHWMPLPEPPKMKGGAE